jgi:hypothetical protein
MSDEPSEANTETVGANEAKGVHLLSFIMKFPEHVKHTKEAAHE